MQTIVRQLSTWPLVKLGDTIDLLTGFPFKSANYTEDESGIRLLRGDNVAQGNLRWNGVKRWPANQAKDYERFELRVGDVILAMDRPWIEAGLKYATVQSNDLPALLVQRVARLRGTTALRTEYLRYVIGSEDFTEYVKAITTGTSVPHISASDICDYEFMLPSLADQQKIAGILFSWDRAIDLTTRLIKAKRERNGGLMQLLLTERKRFPNFHQPWSVVKVSDCLSESRIQGSDGRTARKITVRLYGRGVVPKEERSPGSEATKYFKRRAGQFIYSKLDFLNGAFGIIPSEMDGYESTLDLPCFDFKDTVLPQFFLYFVSRESFYSQFAGAAVGGRKARRIQVDEFLSAEIKVPELAEQRQIANCLAACDRELSLLHRKLTLLKQQKLGLMQQLITGRVRVPA